MLVGLGEKEKIFFFEISCQVKKQLYICSRLGKHLRETKPGGSQGPRAEWMEVSEIGGGRSHKRRQKWARGTEATEYAKV
ncbi:hypothetical protein CSC80_09785 [Maribacter sp. 6B07]|nr:hypothetical protein CSC80_09785 [Maribacter sp. 6B07]